MRIAITIPAALLVTLVLFYLMQAMIKGNGQPIERPKVFGTVDLVRLRPATETTPNQRASTKPLARPQPPLPAPPPAPQIPLAAVQPPEVAPPHEPLTAPLQAMQLGKPYLGPLATTQPNGKLAKRTAPLEQIERPRKPASVQPTTAEPKSVVNPPSLQPGTVESARLSPPKGPLSGSEATSDAMPELAPGSGSAAADEAIAVFKIKPEYPRKAARSKVEGWVKVEFTITEQGTVTDAVVVDSKPRRTFDRSAVKSIRRWRFKPKLVDGKPVARKASQIIEFKLAKG